MLTFALVKKKYHNTRLFYPTLAATFADRLFSTPNTIEIVVAFMVHIREVQNNVVKGKHRK